MVVLLRKRSGLKRKTLLSNIHSFNLVSFFMKNHAQQVAMANIWRDIVITEISACLIFQKTLLRFSFLFIQFLVVFENTNSRRSLKHERSRNSKTYDFHLHFVVNAFCWNRNKEERREKKNVDANNRKMPKTKFKKPEEKSFKLENIEKNTSFHDYYDVTCLRISYKWIFFLTAESVEFLFHTSIKNWAAYGLP